MKPTDMPFTIDKLDLRQALGRFATGVAIVTTAGDDAHVGVTVNSFAAVSLDPPLVLWSLRNQSPSLAAFIACGHYVVHVLALEQEALCQHFSNPAPNKFASIEHDFGVGGCPVLRDCLATFECAIEQTIAAGDHTIFLGRVSSLSYRDGEPLIFAQGRLSCLAPPTPLYAAA